MGPLPVPVWFSNATNDSRLSTTETNVTDLREIGYQVDFETFSDSTFNGPGLPLTLEAVGPTERNAVVQWWLSLPN